MWKERKREREKKKRRCHLVIFHILFNWNVCVSMVCIYMDACGVRGVSDIRDRQPEFLSSERIMTKCRITHGLELVYQYKCQLFILRSSSIHWNYATRISFSVFAILLLTWGETQENQKHIFCKLIATLLWSKVAAHVKNIYEILRQSASTHTRSYAHSQRFVSPTNSFHCVAIALKFSHA